MGQLFRGKEYALRICLGLSQFRGGLGVELKTTSLPLNDHTVIASRRFYRYIPRPHVGKNKLGRSIKWIPKAASARRLHRKTISFVDLRRFYFTRGKFDYRTVGALDGDSIRQRLLTAVQPPGRADRALDVRVDGGRSAHANSVRHRSE